jgi:hypothetical protein
MELEITMLSEISQTEKDEYHMFLSLMKSRPKKKNETSVKWGYCLGPPSSHPVEG